jgi:hypothetical protein
MNRFYQRVDISYYDDVWEENVEVYQGKVFVGVSFRDQKGIRVTSNKKVYKLN